MVCRPVVLCLQLYLFIYFNENHPVVLYQSIKMNRSINTTIVIKRPLSRLWRHVSANYSHHQANTKSKQNHWLDIKCAPNGIPSCFFRVVGDEFPVKTLSIKIYIGATFHYLCFDVLILIDGTSLTSIIFNENHPAVLYQSVKMNQSINTTVVIKLPLSRLWRHVSANYSHHHCCVYRLIHFNRLYYWNYSGDWAPHVGQTCTR
jgi:uncharacterized protein YjlB